MIFYCPNCQKEFDVEPAQTISTLQHRVAYKANCPVCSQDMAEFIPGQNNPPPKTPIAPEPVV